MRILGQRGLIVVSVVVVAVAWVLLVRETNDAAAAPSAVATQVSTGAEYSCAVVTDGTGRCWGANGEGQLGNATRTDSSTPVTVAGLTGATTISASSADPSIGIGGFTCALVTQGEVMCWGKNAAGSLGDGTTTDSLTPVKVSGISGATAISVGGGHACALMVDGTIECWGVNYFGQLGDGNRTNTPGPSTPVNVVGISGATAISAGDHHTCAVVGGGVKCWGANEFGYLGDGTKMERHTPTDVVGVSGAVSVSAGNMHTCALLSGGTVKCWGRNAVGGLGDGTTEDRHTAVEVAGLGTAIAVDANNHYSCALLTGGSARCWGSNAGGQLGDGTTNPSSVPVQVSGVSAATSLDVGTDHNCVVISGGAVKCWGWNSRGQLGNGTTTASSTTVDVNGFGGPAETGCKPLYYFAIRGSGENPQGSGATPGGRTYPRGTVAGEGMGIPLEATYGALTRLLRATMPAPEFAGAGVVYRAIPVDANPLNLGQYGEDYQNSIEHGAANLRGELERINVACVGQSVRIVLAGYSQGADVINTAMAQVHHENAPAAFQNVKAVFYFGNPARIGGQTTEVLNTDGLGIRRQTGAPLAVDPATDTWISTHPGMVTSFCAAFDVVCDTSANLKLAPFLGPNNVFNVSIGVSIHNGYSSRDMSCHAQGLPAAGLTITATDCAAALALNAFGYPVPSGSFPEPSPAPAVRAFRPGAEVFCIGKLTEPNSEHRCVLQSTPVEVGTFTTDESRIGAVRFTVPTDIGEGEHHLTIVSASGKTYSVAFTVSSSAPEVADGFIAVDANDIVEIPPPTTTPPPPCTGSFC